MGRIKKGVECSVIRCKQPSVRSFSLAGVGEDMKKAGLKVKDPSARKVYFCEKHYKILKKQKKKSAKFDPRKSKFQGSKRFSTPI
jgi:hypothetical protein